MPSTEFSSPGRVVDRNLVHSRTDGRNDSGHIQGGYLHQMSPSVLRMTKELESLSLSFSDELLKALKEIIESPVIGARCHLNDDIYTTISQLQQLPRQTLYRFQLPFDDQHFSSEICRAPGFGFLLLDQRLPDFLTVLCFGGSLASLVAGADDSAPDDSSSDSSPPAVTGKLTRIGKQLMDQVASALAEVWRTAVCSPYCPVSDTGFSSWPNGWGDH
ncbi:hypothetical protein [Endozoicomonas sp. GU-1]|uniref:hypothetical protein n=1 Tax=Endozoicomonas sp. GU-1 TaxID=3009078 RepID=UPI0022B39C63|nr:hypothetical protein [Endozoicomonas sp. GU-1]WBA82508.1 hypothetical protein O2T12_04995 [Endozoicomonas sp. GU-1]